MLDLGQEASLDFSRPLQGIKVLEFGHVAAGPFAGSLLADLGADVVKVEPPSGDQMRQWPPLERAEGATYSHNFAAMNRNKRSFTANLKNPDELQIVRELVGVSDVLVENYRVGALAKLGLGFDEVSPGHRGLIYCSISGFGHSSPYSTRGAYDVVIQAMGGLMSVTGEPGRPPVKAGVPIADFVTGLYGALSVASLVTRVKESGTSVHVDVPMLDCLLGTSALQTSEYWGSGAEPQALGSAHPRNAPYQAFQAADREIVIAAGSHRLWESVCDVLGVPELVEDERFVDQASRVMNQVELAKVLEDVLQDRPAAEWLEDLEAAGVPVSLVNTYGDILHDRHVRDVGLLVDVDVPLSGPTPMTAFPVRIGADRNRTYSSPPLLGAHNDEVTTEWLMSQS